MPGELSAEARSSFAVSPSQQTRCNSHRVTVHNFDLHLHIYCDCYYYYCSLSAIPYVCISSRACSLTDNNCWCSKSFVTDTTNAQTHTHAPSNLQHVVNRIHDHDPTDPIINSYATIYVPIWLFTRTFEYARAFFESMRMRANVGGWFFFKLYIHWNVFCFSILGTILKMKKKKKKFAPIYNSKL